MQKCAESAVSIPQASNDRHSMDFAEMLKDFHIYVVTLEISSEGHMGILPKIV